MISRFHRGEGGEILLLLSEEERALLREIAGGTLALLAADDDDPALRRLFPPAYDDPKLDQEYRELTRSQLVSGRERALELLAATVDDDVLTLEQADAWLRALNDARLVLGTRLDVTEDLDWNGVDPSDPGAAELAVYAYVSWIQEQLVEAISQARN